MWSSSALIGYYIKIVGHNNLAVKCKVVVVFFCCLFTVHSPSRQGIVREIIITGKQHTKICFELHCILTSFSRILIGGSQSGKMSWILFNTCITHRYYTGRWNDGSSVCAKCANEFRMVTSGHSTAKASHIWCSRAFRAGVKKSCQVLTYSSSIINVH